MKRVLFFLAAFTSLSAFAKDIVYIRHNTEKETFRIVGSSINELKEVVSVCKHKWEKDGYSYKVTSNLPMRCEALIAVQLEELGYVEGSCGKFTRN